MNIFKGLQEFMSNGHISIRKDAIMMFISNKGDKQKTIAWAYEQADKYKDWEEHNPNEYIYNEYMIIIKELED
jgi:hypothetical protein